MTPLRFALPVVLLANPAIAQVCATARPAWQPAQGALTAWGEAALFLTSPLGAVVVLVCAMTWAVRSQALCVIALILSGGVTLFLASAPSLDPGFRSGMQAEGCLGPTWLSALLYAALAAITAWRLWRINQRPL